MNFSELKNFINKKMMMSHIYQPVMLKTLLRNNGKSTTQEIAKSILSNDSSQIEYYEKITKRMVGKVLRNHKIVDKNKNEFVLNDFNTFTEENIDELINLCNIKLEEYVTKRGEQIWKHRKKSSGYISGTLRYEILKQAKFHCELCGISAEEKALEIDHILPRNLGGSDDESNLQALCYSCNSMKRDRDDTDFRKVRKSYEDRDQNCIFCSDNKNIIHENILAYAIRDKFPITNMHTLIIPKRHTQSYFDLGRPEINAVNQLINKLKDNITDSDSEVTGFNIGINDGEVAGQTIKHCHIHLIPRRKGDVEDPIGGIRNTIPDKGNYIKE